MALGYPIEITEQYANNNNSWTLDLSNYDKVSIHLIPPVAGNVYVYGSNNPGKNNVSFGDAQLALDFTAIQATNLATGTNSTSMQAGLYSVPVNAQFLRIQGADVYKIFLFETKIC